MRTFKGQFSMDLKVVVPDEFLATLRHQAQVSDEDATDDQPAATPFLKQVQAQHPTNDDAFLEAVLRNGIRHMVRDNLLGQLQYAGLGGTISPAKISFTAAPRDADGLLVEFDAPANPVTPEKTDA